MDTLTFILALIGSLGTAYSVIMTFYWNRVSINCSVIEYSPAEDSLIAYMSFTNNSRLPISITNICIWNDRVPYSCVHAPEIVKFVIRNSNNNQIFKEAIHSIPLPINLSSLSGTSGYVYFLFPQENYPVSSKSLTVELNTNRHVTIRKTLSLEKRSRIVQ